MRNEAGVPTNGVYQFLRYFLDGVKTFNPSHIICCWDMGSKTFRTEMYPNYKAKCSDPPEELIPQFDLVKKAVISLKFRISVYEIMKLMMSSVQLLLNIEMRPKLSFRLVITICYNSFKKM